MRRTEDHGGWSHFYWGPWSSYLRDFVMAMSIGLMVLTLGLVSLEGKKREDQFCTSTEREHKGYVDQYKDTLTYLDKLRTSAPDKLSDPLNQFVITRLPDNEMRARVDTAPPLCDRKSNKTLNPFHHPTEIGLPEPDPKLPRRTAEQVQRQLAPLIKQPMR